MRDGRAHWHPDHRGNNPSASLLNNWLRAYEEIATKVAGCVRVVGDSALPYPRVQYGDMIRPCDGVVLVYRTGGWCQPQHVARLRHAVERQGYDCTVLTDDTSVARAQQLTEGHPGWWAKMEVMRLPGTHLYMDLDTMIYGDLAPLMALDSPMMLGDFYRPLLESGLMALTQHAKTLVWQRWVTDPARWMREFRGDGRFIADTIGHLCGDIRVEVSGIHSYRIHGLRADTRVLCFHGRPRPHDTPLWSERV